MASRRLLAILIIYLLLAAGYGVVNPIFEAPDEHHHYYTVEYVALNGQLPSLGGDPDPWMRQEAAQPPLYYLLGAVLIAPLQPDPAASRSLHHNPFVRLGDPTSPFNVNAFVHGSAGAWPWRGHVLAVHLLRLLSTLLGLGTLLFVYAGGRLVWPASPEPALLATALIAFLPQFAFIHSTVSNDPLVTLLSAAALWQLLRLWYETRQPMSLRHRLSASVALGITIGLAALTKNQGALLLILALVVLALLAVRQRRLEWLWQRFSLVLVAVAVMVGWLWWRNWTLYGDPTATNQFVRMAGGDRHFTVWQVLGETQTLWTSLFARFGWMNVPGPTWVIQVWQGLIGLALSGLILSVIRPLWRRRAPLNAAPTLSIRRPSPAPWLAFWVLLVYVALVIFMTRTPGAQGRHLFPALLPLALGLVAGIVALRHRWAFWVAGFLALLTTIYCLLVVVRGAYARAPLIAEKEIPAEATRLDADLGQGLELVASLVETTVARPGNDVWLTLYWRTQARPAHPPVVEVYLRGREFAAVGSVSSYHGLGRYPATLWPEGEIVADRFPVRLADNIAAPTQVMPYVQLAGGGEPLPVGALKVTPSRWPPLAVEVLAHFEGGIELVNVALEPTMARPGDAINVQPTWQVKTAVGRDLTTFVHLLDSNGNLVAQGDAPPLSGFYPTRLWAAGEQFADRYTLTLPPNLAAGDYIVSIGLYDPATGARQPLFANGMRQANDALPAGAIMVR